MLIRAEGERAEPEAGYDYFHALGIAGRSFVNMSMYVDRCCAGLHVAERVNLLIDEIVVICQDDDADPVPSARSAVP